MESAEINNLNRDEMFEMLKAKGKTSTNNYTYGLLLLLTVILLGMGFLWPIQELKNEITFLISMILLCCLEGWLLLYNYRFKKKIDTIETPDQLLQCYEKKKRYENIFGFYVLILIALFTINLGWHKGIFLLAAALGSIIYFFMNGSYLNRKETKIVEQLRKLLEKKSAS